MIAVWCTDTMTFKTAKVLLPAKAQIDFVTARSEKYPLAASLPVVKPDSLVRDLNRRDFTINAMAVALSDLSPKGSFDCSDCIDPTGGLIDIDSKLIRFMHPKSFLDDPTRIWRALRYASRFRFDLGR